MSNAAIEIINLEIQDLKKRLAELQQALETLRASDGKKSTTQGRGPNSAFTVHSETLDVLREASAPMTVQEIVDAINANGLVGATRSAVDAALRRLREKKLADRIPDSQPRQWVAVFQSDLSTPQ